MGEAMEEGTIVRWLKSEGDDVAEEEFVAEVRTDKINIEIMATDAGKLTRILVQEGETVPVNTPIAQIGEDGGAPAAGPAAQTDREQTPGQAEPQRQAEAPREEPSNGTLPHGGAAPAPEAAAPQAGGRVKASPLARKIAAEAGIDLQAVEGTGPGGRIVEADVREAIERGVAPQRAAASGIQPAVPQPVVPGTDRPLSPMRKIIARRLVESKQQIPHFYLSIDVDMRAATRLRAEFNGSVDEDRKISFNDLVVRACALALEKMPEMSSQLNGDSLRTPDSVNVGVAVSLDEGLIVPVLRNANQKSLSVLGQETRELAGRARKGQLKPEEYSGGTFTVSNLGMYEITHFQAIINPPEAAIVAVGAIRETPIVENGQVVPGKQMYLTLSADHRIVDGAVGARFLQEVKRMLQNPLSLFG